MSKILIIEDNLDIRENIQEILELDGYDVLTAENGKVGVRLAVESLPDLILCDIMMPELDGYGVLHILSKKDETLGIPFIFLTAKAERSDVRKGMTLGADDYIIKPFDEADLLTAIENRLKKHQAVGGGKSSRAGDMQQLFANKTVKTHSVKDLIYRDGDTSIYVYYLAKGKVKVTKMNQDGKEAVLDLCSDGDFFGYWSVLKEIPHSNSAECLEESEIWQIPAADFRQLITENTAVSEKFLKMMTNNLLIKEHKILDLAYESVRKRIATALVDLKEKYSEEGTFRMKVSRETIASMAGTSIETAIRMLSEFKSDGLIEIHGSEITVVDPQKLKTLPY